MRMRFEQPAALRLLRANLPIFIALSSPLRQKIMMMLASGTELNVEGLARQLGLPRPSVSHHIKVLSRAGLLSSQRVGVNLYYKPNFEKPLKSLREFVVVLEEIEKNGGIDAKNSK